MKLSELVAKWRGKAAEARRKAELHPPSSKGELLFDHRAVTLDYCAAELEAALAELPIDEGAVLAYVGAMAQEGTAAREDAKAARLWRLQCELDEQRTELTWMGDGWHYLRSHFTSHDYYPTRAEALLAWDKARQEGKP